MNYFISENVRKAMGKGRHREKEDIGKGKMGKEFGRRSRYLRG